MTILNKGSILPDNILKHIIPLDRGDDFSLAITDSPIFLFIVLNDISDEEETVFNIGRFEFGINVIDKIGFITLNFNNGFLFDFSILDMKDKDNPNNNSFNIVLVEGSDYRVCGIRVVGIDTKLVDVLQKNIRESEGSIEYKEMLAYRIMDRVSAEQIHSGSTMQIFDNQKNNL